MNECQDGELTDENAPLLRLPVNTEESPALLTTIQLMKQQQQQPGGAVHLRAPATFPPGVSDHLSVTHPSNQSSVL